MLNSSSISRGPDGRPLGRREIGALGERIAARHLWANGRRILHRNFRAPHGGEVDLVTRDGTVLAFVEVKTRRSERHGRPVEAVDAAKERLVARGAMAWLRLLGYPDIRFRFDVVEVILVDGQPPVVTVIEAAFELPEPLIYG